jgi:hypothetical protein
VTLDRKLVFLLPFPSAGEGGKLKQRATVLEAVQHLPVVATATDLEVLAFIDAHALHGTGGCVDVHLPAAVLLTPGSTLGTLDKRLHEAATRMNVATGEWR